MEKKFNIGDKVTYLPYNMQGEITAVHSRGLYGVKYPDEDDSFTVNEADLEFTDPKTAFLSELKGLLEKYDAEISAYAVGYDGELDITFNIGNVEILYSENNPIFKGHSVHSITADNIMDYDKE